METSTSMKRFAGASLALALIACGGDDPTDLQSSPAAIAVVSGQDQEGKAGEELPEPFVVRVTDAGGDGVSGAMVEWSVASGDGVFMPGFVRSSIFTATEADGIARAFFRPSVVGTSTVTAEAAGLEDSPATFATDATVMVIRLKPFFDSGCRTPADPQTFIPHQVTVPVGAPVEWVYWSELGSSCEAHVVSIAEPAGGGPFDSEILSPGERFRFVPEVAGTWEYQDQVAGETGTFTVQ